MSAVHRASLRFILGCLVMVAMGLSQLLGVSRGFWCLCTSVPKVVQSETCEPAACHAVESHAGEEALIPEHHDPDGGDHQHHEARESLKTTAVATTISLPVPVVYELPPSVLVAAPCEWAFVPSSRATRLFWIRDGSPPMPVLVARTMVRLV
jgi:hypothetical protein